MAKPSGSVQKKLTQTTTLLKKASATNVTDVLDDTKTKKTTNTPKTSYTDSADIRGNAIKEMKLRQNTDRRVCLRVAPNVIGNDNYNFANRIAYVLGTQEVSFPNSVGAISDNSFFRGFLRSQLGKSEGLIFPYTPKISMGYTVNYESTDFIHSNISFKSYKNSPPPTVSLTAKFTADTKANAIQMLSAIWFFQACSKCDTGTNLMQKSDDRNTANRSGAGLPPPVLYLDGYANLFDNMPVIIGGFTLDYPDEIDYVRLDLQMAIHKPSQLDLSNPLDETLKQTNPLLDDYFSFYTTENLANGTDVSNYTSLTFWLPMTMTIPITLYIQPNLAQDIKTFSLDAYKSGVLKNKGFNNLISSNGTINIDGLTSSQTGSNTTTGTKNLNRKFIPNGWSW